MNKDKFQELLQRSWRQQLHDSGTGDWHNKWFLDGERAVVRNSEKGIVYSGGPVANDHASHTVLWTKDIFEGDIKIEFDYTRLDTINRYVNILYIQATGIGTPPYNEDITDWSDLRVIPYMNSYFDNMNLLHVSYAAFGNEDDDPSDYVRARRYPRPVDASFGVTGIEPDYFATHLFKPGVEYHFTFIKTNEDLFFEVKNAEEKRLFHWPLKDVKALKAGRVGIRHMWTRCSRYRNILISSCSSK